MTLPPRYAIIGSRGYPSTYGGFETLVRRLAPYLRDTGAQVTVYGRDSRRSVETRVIDGIEVVSTPGLEGKSTSTLTYGMTSCAHAARQGFDAALVLNVANGFWLPRLRRAGIPTVVNVDGLEWERDKWSRAGKAVFKMGARLTARYADHLIADARAIGDYWQANFGVGSEFIPYGADLDRGDADDRITDLGLVPGSYLLVVARLVPENNVDLFLDAVEKLPPGTPAVVVGSAGGAKSPLEERLARMDLQRPGFRWLGHVSDQVLLTQLWRHCALYVHGHSVGGTNPALVQALGLGSPTVALDTVFSREVLGAGWPTYPVDDPDRLASLVTDLLASPEVREKLSIRGREIIELRYRWDDVLGAYAELLERAAERTRTRALRPLVSARPGSEQLPLAS